MSIFLFTVVSLASEIAINPHQSTPKRNQVLQNHNFARYVSEFIEPTVHFFAYDETAEGFLLKFIQPVKQDLTEKYLTNLLNETYDTETVSHTKLLIKFPGRIVELLSEIPITRLKAIQQIEIEAKIVVLFTEQIFQRLKSAGIRIVIKAGNSHVKGTWPIYIFKFADKIEAVELDDYDIGDMTNLLEYSDKIEKIKLELWIYEEYFQPLKNRKEKINGGYFPKVHLNEKLDAIKIKDHPTIVGLEIFDSIQEMEINIVHSSVSFDRQYSLYLDIIHKVEIITIYSEIQSEKIVKLLETAKPKKIVLHIAQYDLSKISSLDEVEIHYPGDVLLQLPFGNIKKLRIDHCGSFDMQSLYGLQRLESLYVICNRIRFHSLENFKKLKEIEYLFLWFSGINEEEYTKPKWMEISEIPWFKILNRT